MRITSPSIAANGSTGTNARTWSAHSHMDLMICSKWDHMDVLRLDTYPDMEKKGGFADVSFQGTAGDRAIAMHCISARYLSTVQTIMEMMPV